MVRGQRKRASHEEAEETRRTILRVARELFMEYGYRAVSTRQIADACGLTQPALYHYFADKQDLYVAMAMEEIAKMRAALERVAGRNESVDERLRRVALYLLNATQHDLGLMLHDIRYELAPKLQSILNEAFQAGVVGPISSIFSDGLREGVLRDQQHGGMDAMTATHLFMSMISSILTGSRNPVSGGLQVGHNDVDLVKLTVHVLLHGLAYSEVEGPELQSKTDE